MENYVLVYKWKFYSDQHIQQDTDQAHEYKGLKVYELNVGHQIYLYSESEPYMTIVDFGMLLDGEVFCKLRLADGTVKTITPTEPYKDTIVDSQTVQCDFTERTWEIKISLAEREA